MFCGLNLKPNYKYTFTPLKTFRLSQASLHAESAQNGANKIYVTCENEKYLICTLRKGKCEQVQLDLNFATGEKISFQTVGSGHVTLLGYQSEDESDLEEAIIEEDLRSVLNKKAKGKYVKAYKAKANVGNMADYDEDDDSDANINKKAKGKYVKAYKAKANVGNMTDDDEDDEEKEIDEEEVQEPKAKKAKLGKQQNGVASMKVCSKRHIICLPYMA